MKKRLAKKMDKTDQIISKNSKTYVDQIFDFIRVYDPKFMAISPDESDSAEEEIMAEEPSNRP